MDANLLLVILLRGSLSAFACALTTPVSLQITLWYPPDLQECLHMQGGRGWCCCEHSSAPSPKCTSFATTDGPMRVISDPILRALTLHAGGRGGDTWKLRLFVLKVGLEATLFFY